MAVEVGAPLSKAVINSQLGTAAQTFKRGLEALEVLEEWQRAYDAPALIELGFTDAEAAQLKSGLGELPPISAAVDATTWLKRFWGVGGGG